MQSFPNSPIQQALSWRDLHERFEEGLGVVAVANKGGVQSWLQPVNAGVKLIVEHFKKRQKFFFQLMVGGVLTRRFGWQWKWLEKWLGLCH